jgi:hypothetical protein
MIPAKSRVDPSSDRNAVRVSLAVAVLSVIVACAISRPWEQVHLRDGAYYAYLAELSARGIIPYRDVFHIQGPILIWLGGWSVWLGGTTGLIVQGALVAGLMTFGAALLSIGAQRGRSVIQVLPVALVAWGVSTGWPFIGRFIVSGSRPKFLAVGLAAIAVYLLCTGRRARVRVCCGAAFGAACWVWQPAATIVMGSLAGWTVVRLRQEGQAAFRELVHTALQLLLGVITFSAAMIAVFLVQGSLDEFISQAIDFSRSDVGPGATWNRLVTLLPVPVMVVGGAGLLAFVTSLFRRANPEARLPARAWQIRGAVFGWLAAYAALIWIDFDYFGDTVPLLLPLGVFAGALVSRVEGVVGGWGAMTVAAILTLWLAGGDMLLPGDHSRHSYSLGQRIRSKAAPNVLETARGRGVLIFADVLLAQKVGEDPKHPYVYWEPHTIDYIEEYEEGGMDGFLERLIAERYGVVAVGPRARDLLPYLTPRLQGLYEVRRSFRKMTHFFVLQEP